MPPTIPAFGRGLLRESRHESSREAVQPSNLLQAVHAVVHESAIPPKAIASDAGCGYAYLLKAADEQQEGVQFQARLVAPVTKAAKNDVLIKFLSEECGGVFYRLSPDGTMDAATATTLREFSEYLASVADAEADQKVTPAEYHRVKAKAHETISALLSHVDGLRIKAGLQEDCR